MQILLSPEDVSLADSIAQKRQSAAEAKGRISGNGGATRGTVALQNHILGARCELAAKRYLDPVDWNSYSEFVSNNLPDLSTFIDVKGIAKPTHRAILQRNDRDDWAYLLVSSHAHPSYLIMGWVYGHEAKRPEFWQDPAGGRPAYFVNSQILRQPSELLGIVRGMDRAD